MNVTLLRISRFFKKTKIVHYIITLRECRLSMQEGGGVGFYKLAPLISFSFLFKGLLVVEFQGSIHSNTRSTKGVNSHNNIQTVFITIFELIHNDNF